MAEIIGHLNLIEAALPTGVDGTRLAQWALRDGITWPELANMVSLSLAQANQDLVRKWGWLFFLTEEPMMEYEQGGSVTPMPEFTDEDRPQATKGSTIGHMIDLHAYGDAVGGTRRYFRDARRAKITAAINTIVRRGVWRFEQKLLSRWLTNTENGVGSTGYDVPFVRGTGGNVNFAPPAYEGEAFTTSHDHYLGYNSSTEGVSFDDMLNGLGETLQEHGHEPPFRAIVSRSDVSSYAALSDYVQMVNVPGLIIDRGGATTGNELFRVAPQWQGGHFGDFQSDYGLIELFATARIATGYAGLCKSYGQLDARNPLAVRVHPDLGFGFMLVPETVPDVPGLPPVKQLDIEFEFGVSVGMDRTNGAAALLVAGGAWANPTIS